MSNSSTVSNSSAVNLSVVRTVWWPLVSFMVVALTLAGCSMSSQTSSPLYERLSSRGPVVLGLDNPYLPANLFLEEQIKESVAIRRLVQEQGRPTAVGIDRRLFRTTRITLYYSDDNESFTMTRWGRDWNVEEPSAISPSDRDSIVQQLALSDELHHPRNPQYFITPPVARASLRSAPVVSGRAPEERRELRGRLKSPQQAAEAELSRLTNGNYRHTVTFRGETLRLIAEWYTEDPANAAALATASNRSTEQVLKIGEAITIPRRLMRNATPLPEARLP